MTETLATKCPQCGGKGTVMEFARDYTRPKPCPCCAYAEQRYQEGIIAGRDFDTKMDNTANEASYQRGYQAGRASAEAEHDAQDNSDWQRAEQRIADLKAENERLEVEKATAVGEQDMWLERAERAEQQLAEATKERVGLIGETPPS